MTLGRFGLFFALSAVGAYAFFGLLGLAASPSLGDPLSGEETIAALSFSFPGEGGEWTEVSGYASRGWLYRRAYVEGVSANGARHAEQILKVGWPFTVVRGFVRSGDAGTEHLGVGWSSASMPARLLPVQPVWPGIVIWGVLGAIPPLAWKR